MEIFDKRNLSKLYRPSSKSKGEDNGQVTIIGGSKLFHGAPVLSLKAASRIVDMVFFTSPESSIGEVASLIKSKLLSFIWVPWDEVEKYIEKSDAVLVGPGFMSFRSEKDKSIVEETKKVTKELLERFPDKRWVIDAGSLQVIDPEFIPKGAILTPNKKEFKILFGNMKIEEAAKKYNCIIVLKGPETIVCLPAQAGSPKECVLVKGGNPGLTKGGTGDVLAGLTVALLAKNEPFLAATSASYIAKAAADELYKSVGTNYNADNLTDEIPKAMKKLLIV